MSVADPEDEGVTAADVAVELGFQVVYVVVPMAIAWRWDWTWAWAMLGVVVLINVTDLLWNGADRTARASAEFWATPKNPRGRLKLRLDALATAVALAVPVVWGLEGRAEVVRYSDALKYAALAAVLLVGLLGTRTASLHPAFGPEGRARVDQEVPLLPTGLFRYVRAPGLALGTVSLMSTMILMDSAWAFVLAGFRVVYSAAALIEDDLDYQARIPGWEAYARKTRWLFVPFVY